MYVCMYMIVHGVRTSEYGSKQLKVWVNGEGWARVKMRLMVRVREQMSPQVETEVEGRARHNRGQESRWREWGSWRGYRARDFRREVGQEATDGVAARLAAVSQDRP